MPREVTPHLVYCTELTALYAVDCGSHPFALLDLRRKMTMRSPSTHMSRKRRRAEPAFSHAGATSSLNLYARRKLL